jgi:subtilisin family serine protease
MSAQGNKLQFAPGQIIVQERAGANPAAVSSALSTVGGKLLNHIPQTKHHVLSVPEGQVDKIIAALLKTGLFSVAERDGLASVSGTPNDPSFPSQWHLVNISAAGAWATTTGSSSPIAVIDSGAYLTHPDLASRLTGGWNFLLNNSNTADDQGHGTATAGTLGAVTNNLTGVAGVTWTNPVMPLVVVDSTGYASYSNIASAITYAADHGARIVNISIAGSTSSSTLQSAVDYAWNKGTVVFAAAGNNSSSTPMYPANCNNVLAIAATDSHNALASFSNYGSWIDLSAPGLNILTTNSGGGYGYWYGTSFASPIAAGVGALVLAAKPSLSAASLVSILEANADNIGSSSIFGHGLVDAAKAVAAAVATTTVTPSVSITAPTSGAGVTGTVNVTGSATDSLGISGVKLYCDGLLVTSSSSSSFSIPWNSGTVTAGSHTLNVMATDNSGNTGSSSVSVMVSAPPPPPVDTTPPTVQITSPANGAKVSGSISVTISVTAQDNVGVSQVSIYVDGVQQYTGTAAPYSFKWNLKKLTLGAHTISATAWDAAGNHTSTSITVYE